MIFSRDKDVYIIFGDDLRSDGLNIYGVFASLKSAEDEVARLSSRRPCDEFHIEEHALYE